MSDGASPLEQLLKAGVRVGAALEQRGEHVRHLALDGGMQGRAPCARMIRVCALSQQEEGHLRMFAVNGDQQCRRFGVWYEPGPGVGVTADAVRRSLVHVGPSGQEQPGRLDVALLDREQQRCGSIRRASGDGPAHLQKYTGHRGVILDDGSHERRLAQRGFGGVGVRAGGDESSYHVEVADLRRSHERGFTVGAGQIGVGSGRQ
jgi:hypothetical protein